MRIKDIFSTVATSSLFTALGYEIDGFTTEQLDAIFISKYGERQISPFLSSFLTDGIMNVTNLQLLGLILRNEYSNTWNNQKIILDHEYNPWTDYSYTQNTTSNNTHNSNSTTDYSNYGYSSTTASEKDVQATTGGGTDANNSTIQQKSIDYANINSMMKNWIEARTLRLINIVFSDLKRELSLDIYEL